MLQVGLVAWWRPSQTCTALWAPQASRAPSPVLITASVPRPLLHTRHTDLKSASRKAQLTHSVTPRVPGRPFLSTSQIRTS